MNNQAFNKPSESDLIPLCVPEIVGREWQYIKECLDTNWVSSVGAFVDKFEIGLASYIGVKRSVATTSGTAALHIALLVAGVQPDEEVLVSTLTFIAPANAIRYVGAWPLFVDADPVYWQMDISKLYDFVKNDCDWESGSLHNKHTGRRITAIMPVDILGHSCDIEPIVELARQYNLVVIEDATESLGSQYYGHMVGQLADIACFSFNGNKTITTGGGGLLVTNNDEWANRARYLTTQAKDNAIEYIHNEIGYNYRLTNLQAAMGCAQLESLDDYVMKKRSLALVYSDALNKVDGIKPMVVADWCTSSYWLYTVLVDPNEYGITSRGLMSLLTQYNIQTRPLWQPNHLSPAHAQSYYLGGPVSENLFNNALSLPSSVGLTKEQQNRVIECVVSSQI